MVSTRTNIGVWPMNSALSRPGRAALDFPGALGLALTFLKVPVAVLLAYGTLHHWELAMAALALLVIPLDILDGMVFRRSRMARSYSLGKFRRVTDSVLDRVVVQSALVCAVAASGLPVELYALVLCREALISGVFLHRLFTSGRVTEGVVLSKLATALIAVQYSWQQLHLPGMQWLAALFIVVALASVAQLRFKPKYF